MKLALARLPRSVLVIGKRALEAKAVALQLQEIAHERIMMSLELAHGVLVRIPAYRHVQEHITGHIVRWAVQFSADPPFNGLATAPFAAHRRAHNGRGVGRFRVRALGCSSGSNSFVHESLDKPGC